MNLAVVPGLVPGLVPMADDLSEFGQDSWWVIILKAVMIFLILVLTPLFMPLVKAVVIWIAASGRTSSGPLLALAERFGKWSMLEVFIAALLITALKLGPVVDATLHYGAYLLAGSVLLAGAASQLLPHSRRSVPLFSSPVTLMLGGIGGAVAAKLRLRPRLRRPKYRDQDQPRRCNHYFPSVHGSLRKGQ